tara:strand:- start:872 stop:1672 length:801 start_codon:yes stop_codon:yes gene_type:complete
LAAACFSKAEKLGFATFFGQFAYSYGWNVQFQQTTCGICGLNNKTHVRSQSGNICVQVRAWISEKRNYYALGKEMMSYEPHPARRKGEVNCTGHGRDWGQNSHILPGRRVNEPNHQAWKSRMAAGIHKYEPSDADGDGLFADYIEEASVAVTRTFENSVGILKSVMEMMAFLEGIRVMHHDGAVAPKADKRLDRLSNGRFTNRASENATHERNGLSSEFMVQLHNMCTNGQNPCRDHVKVTKRYGTYLEPEHEIIPPKPRVTRYDH